MSLASYQFLPEVQEEEERVEGNDPFIHGHRPTRIIVRGGRRNPHCFWVPGDVPILEDNLPDVSEEEEEGSTGPFFPKLPKGMSLEQAIVAVLKRSPKYAVEVYEKAKNAGNTEVLGLLPGLIRKLVVEGRYSKKLFEQTRRGPWSCRRVLKDYAVKCSVAAEMVEALR